MIVAYVGSLDSPLFSLHHKFGTVCEFDRKRKPSNQEHCLSRVEYLGNDPVTPPTMSNYIYASRETYPFFAVPLTKIYRNKIRVRLSSSRNWKRVLDSQTETLIRSRSQMRLLRMPCLSSQLETRIARCLCAAA